MSTTRAHSMPFGAEVQADGSVRFRLWAPAAASVELCLHPGPDADYLTMQPESEGWFSCTTAAAEAGSHYLFRIDKGIEVPDPASRCQPREVHGPSQVIDPGARQWQDGDWRGRPWEETVIYELHVGTFTPEGTFAAAREKLDYLAELGVTAVELMPVGEFPGSRNWGYDGVDLFAVESRYGGPDALKAFVEAAHARGLMVFLDVVYNHFGPEGNYLHQYAPQFFTERHHTPWGAAINFDGPDSTWVRQFFIHNALYWLTEYHFDGLRFDAVHAIVDDSQPDILTELAETVHASVDGSRPIHLMLENDDNAAHYLERGDDARPRWYVSQWNDDIHHVLHVLSTGETQGYYADYADEPMDHLGRCLTQGFAYQGEPSPFRGGRPRGEATDGLPPSAFIDFIQNHDQIGNRAFGERLASLTDTARIHALTAVLLLQPAPPLLFMGQEWGCDQPFLFFCDLGADLAEAVIQGRRDEFADFPEFRDPAARERIPDPMDSRTFLRCVLDWGALDRAPHSDWLERHRSLLQIRRHEIVPHLQGLAGRRGTATRLAESALAVSWELQGATLSMIANLGDTGVTGTAVPPGRRLYTTHPDKAPAEAVHTLPPWSVSVYLHAGETPA